MTTFLRAVRSEPMFQYDASWRPAFWRNGAIAEAVRRLASDEAKVRRAFWRKAQSLAAALPFAEDLLAAYYCAFDRETPMAVKTSLLAALAYFVLPFDFV